MSSLSGLIGSVFVLLLLTSVDAGSTEDTSHSKPNGAQLDAGLQDSKALRAQNDRNFRRTTLLAYFESLPDDPACFALGGLFALETNGVVSLTYPHAAVPNVGIGSVNKANERILTFQSVDCRIRLFISKEVLDGDQWISLSPN
jgi:hypothetical protein